MSDYTFHDYCKAAGVRKPPLWARRVKLGKKPMKHQVEALREGLMYPQYGDFSQPGCVSADTEYLSPGGWVRMDEYKGGLVAQFHPHTKEIEWVNPLNYIKAPCGEMVAIDATRGTSQRLSFDHRMLFYTDTGQIKECEAWEYLEWHNNGPDKERRKNAKFYVAFKAARGKPGMAYTNEVIRLMVAVIADGHYPDYDKGRRTNYCIVRLKKERKKERLRELLGLAGVEFKERESTAPTAQGFHIFTFYPPEYMKEFKGVWWDASPSQLKVIADELPHWDSSVDARRSKGVRFSSFSKASADFAQYAFASQGLKTSLTTHTRHRRDRIEVEYGVQVSMQQPPMVGGVRREGIYRVPNPEGFKYCFEVPSSFLLLRHNGYIFATGNCGKTLSAQALAILRAAAGNKAVVLTPPRLNLQFYESMLADFEGLPLTAAVYNGELDARQADTDRYERTGWPSILVMSYRTFVGNKNGKGRRVTDRDGNEVGWRTFLARGYSMLVVDEASMIKNHKSQIHKAVEGFRGYPPENGLWLMTGSPIQNTPEDAYAFFNLLAPNRYGSFRSFERMHVILDRFSSFRKVLGYDNLGYLHEGLYANGRRVTKNQVMELPPVSYSSVPVVLSRQHKELYDTLVNELLIELPDDVLLDFTSASKLYQAAQRVLLCPEGVARTPVKDNALLDTVDELLSSLGGGKAVLGCWYQDSVRKLLAHLHKYNPVALYGGTDNKATEAAKAKFINDPECKVILTNYTSGGVGVDGLQTVCSTAIAVELITVPGLFDQWVSRLNRKGQKEPVTVHLLAPKGTIAIKLKQQLLRKESDANYVVGDKKKLIAELLGEV
jgi:hypothetical protein